MFNNKIGTEIAIKRAEATTTPSVTLHVDSAAAHLGMLPLKIVWALGIVIISRIAAPILVKKINTRDKINILVFWVRNDKAIIKK